MKKENKKLSEKNIRDMDSKKPQKKKEPMKKKCHK